MIRVNELRAVCEETNKCGCSANKARLRARARACGTGTKHRRCGGCIQSGDCGARVRAGLGAREGLPIGTHQPF